MAARHSLDLDTDPRSIIGIREFDAPRDLVFSVWTDPKHLAQWWGPIGFRTTTSSFDMRPGGVWRFVMHGPDGRDYQNRITYDEIVPPERIVFHHGGGEDVEPVQHTMTVVFEDLGGRTRLTMRLDFPSAAERDRVIKEYGAAEGLTQTMARMAEYVAAMAQELKPPQIAMIGSLIQTAVQVKLQETTNDRQGDKPCKFNRICLSKAVATRRSNSIRRRSAPRSTC